jgi:hypothetical protein
MKLATEKEKKNARDWYIKLQKQRVLACLLWSETEIVFLPCHPGLDFDILLFALLTRISF